MGESISKLFLSLDLKSSRWSRGSNTPNCGLYKKEEIFKYCKLVGFSNPVKAKRFKEIQMPW
ncbi:hypothetical protein CMI38_04980 [Candidatus Pacearchaeota archaeon]|nr:hypothetical protein [Candidatus Pacearchaeota archaeon]